ncbi:MAG: ZIP family metal transporter, partial [Endomicrobium sp.]|nr:ZIP family metal transporter [Endomicrobium sp.]
HIGILTTAIIILHKLSDGITATGLLLHKQHYKNNLSVLILSILISSFTPLGTVISSLYLKNSISITLLGAMFCMTAGMFIFITSTEFIPEMFQIANKKDKLVSYLLFLFGILTTIIVE